MRLSGSFKVPRIDFTRYRRELLDKLSDKTAEAAFNWLRSTTDDIPVWSGASLATFLKLAREISFQLFITPVNSAPNRISLGASKSDGEFTADAEKGRFTFLYSTTLDHLIYNEFNNANVVPDPSLFFRLKNPGPYKFQEKGLLAFKQVAATGRLPDPYGSAKGTPFKVR